MSAARQGFMRERAMPRARTRPPGRLGWRAVSLLDRAIVRALPAVPRSVVQRVSSRYIAGPTLADARAVVAKLNAHGKMATVDVLGEEITQAAEDGGDRRRVRGRARRVRAGRSRRERQRQADRARAQARLRPLQAERRAGDRRRRADEPLRAHRHGGLDDDGRHAAPLPRAARRGARPRRARPPGLAEAHGRRRRGARGRERPPLQGDLRRAGGDPVPGRRRRCGSSFVRALEALLDGGCYAAIATHDEWLVERSLRLVRERGLAPEQYEFQMLLGDPARPRRPARRPKVTGCGSTCPTAASGTSTRSAGSRRTRRSPATSRPTRSAGSSRPQLGKRRAGRAGSDVFFLHHGAGAGAGRTAADGPALDVLAPAAERRPSSARR